MKTVLVNESFRDRYSNEKYKAGHTYSMDEARIAEVKEVNPNFITVIGSALVQNPATEETITEDTDISGVVSESDNDLAVELEAARLEAESAREAEGIARAEAEAAKEAEAKALSEMEALREELAKAQKAQKAAEKAAAKAEKAAKNEA